MFGRKWMYFTNFERGVHLVRGIRARQVEGQPLASHPTEFLCRGFLVNANSQREMKPAHYGSSEARYAVIARMSSCVRF